MNPPEATLKAQTETTEPPLKKFRRFAQDTAARASTSSIAPLASVDNELVLYISSADNAETNSLAFWQQKSAAFPLLVPLALDLHSAPALQAYVERVFSVCGDLTSGKRNHLSKALENRAFGQINLKYYA